MTKTAIEWTDVVWNPVTGCSKISSGCTNCYAESIDRRFRKDFKPWTAHNAEHNVRLHPERLEQPLHWKKPRRVFVNSMSDLFHEQVSYHFICKVFHIMTGEASYEPSPRHTYQILTKRPRRMYEFFKWLENYPGPEEFISALNALWFDDAPKYVWLGISAEDQRTFDERVKYLIETPAAVRFVSLEPLIGPVSLRWLPAWPENAPTIAMNPSGRTDHLDGARKLDLVIVGGESGPRARAAHPEWLRSIRDQCLSANVPFFLKQRGEYLPISEARVLGLKWSSKMREMDSGAYFPEWMCRVGKKAAGRELDGRTWDEMPEVR